MVNSNKKVVVTMKIKNTMASNKVNNRTIIDKINLRADNNPNKK